MGKKRKPEFMKKTKDIGVRMTEHEMQMLTELCEKKGMTVSELIRYLILNEFYNRS